MNEHKPDADLNSGPQAYARADERTPFECQSDSSEFTEHASDDNAAKFRPAEAWLLLEVLRRRWTWVVGGGIVCALLGFFAAWMYWKPGYIASARLVRNDSPRSAQVFTYQTLTPQTFVSLLKSPELFARVAEQADPPVTTDKFAKRLQLTPEREGDVVLVEVFGPTKQAAVDLANLYNREAVEFTQQLQARAAEEVKQFIEPQLKQVNAEIATLKDTKRPLPKAMPTTVMSRPSPLALKLASAREELVDALTRYTETHPVVQAARAKVEALEQQMDEPVKAPALPTEAELAGQLAIQRDAWEMLRSELAPLENVRRDLIERLRAAQLVTAEPPGYYRELAPAALRDVKGTKRGIKIGAATMVFGFGGMIAFALLALLVEFFDRRLKAPADVTRVTGLPMIGSAPDLTKMSAADRANWAFRTWMTLQGRLSPNANHGIVCGVTSAGRGEGRSTWIKLLARAASESGFRVVTVTAQHGAPSVGEATSARPNGKTNGHHVPSVNAMSALPSPREVENKLVGSESQRVVQIPLPGWVWNLERRKQWQSALDEWRQIGNVVILVELPPAFVPETILLAQELPNLIWLTDSERSEASETRAQLETLRNARCRLVGAVLNRAPYEHVRNRFARWFATAPALLLMANLSYAQPAFTDQPAITNRAAATNAASATPGNLFSTQPRGQRAGWQQRFTLGPGDVVRIALYGEPQLTRQEVIIAPDGRAGFLEAQNVLAAGKTVDEFRSALDEELAKFRRAPRTMVTPLQIRSKKYCVLGKVVERGVYPLEHPTTVLEAVARAKGFEIGLREQDSVDLVDLQRSFLMRNGRRVDINFEKMFLDGDFSQNIYLEPGDYLFFPSTGIQEIQVVGDVRYPGPVTYTPGLTVVAAIAHRAGFNEKAFRSRVLVVRGSLENPETFVVDTNEVLDGQQKDFRLQPKDIVYVAKRPWWRAEELVDLAITAFLQSVVTSFVGQEIIEPIDLE